VLRLAMQARPWSGGSIWDKSASVKEIMSDVSTTLLARLMDRIESESIELNRHMDQLLAEIASVPRSDRVGEKLESFSARFLELNAQTMRLAERLMRFMAATK